MKPKFKTQYGWDRYKLLESPDYVSKYKLSFSDDDSLAFGYYDGIMYVNKRFHGDHPKTKEMNLIRNDFTYPGRIWKDSKIISFWRYPSKEEFYKVILDIENNSDVIFDDDWMVEVVDDSMGSKESAFVFLDDYSGSPEWEEEMINTEHEKSPMLKTKRKPTYIKRKTVEDRFKQTTSESIKSFEDFNESLRDQMKPKDEKEINDKILKKTENLFKMPYMDIADLWVAANKQTKKKIEDKLDSEQLKTFKGVLRSWRLLDYMDSDLAKTDEWMQ